MMASLSDPRRFAHTAEHILNAVMQRDYGSGRSLEAHLGEKKSKCDYRVHRPLNEGDARAIELAVNREIEADHRVETFSVSRAEAESTYDMGKVPASAETIRIVRIGALDIIPCVGNHAEHTGQLGQFVLRSFDMRTEDVVRLRFSLQREL